MGDKRDMKIFRKYSFSSKIEAIEKINSIDKKSHAIVHLGHLVEQKGTYDEEGNEITPPVMSSTYHIDVLWDGQPDLSWDNQLVWCKPVGVHVFGSSSAIREWTEKCKELHPEYFPEPSEEI